MKNFDSIIYLDADTLAVSDLSELWETFAKFTSKQMFACAQEREVWSKKNWYDKRSLVYPFHEPYGINSGVILMNLTRMREFNFVEKIIRLYEHYKKSIVLIDQDLLNILAYYNPG